MNGYRISEQRQCSSCSAIVEAAKAFCPECGTPMEPEEQRVSPADIDKLTRTFRIDEDRFRQMLKEMKLSPEETVAVIRQTQLNLNIDLSEILKEDLSKPLSQSSEKHNVKNSVSEKRKFFGVSLRILILIAVLVLLLIVLILELLFLF